MLKRKQQAFVSEYLVDFNATQAAIRAGYSEKTAGSIGSENLTKSYIAEAISEKLSALGIHDKDVLPKKRMHRKSSNVYLMREGFNNFVKIGIATNVQNRLTTLQTSCPQKIDLIFCASVEDASEHERHLHKKYQDKHFFGEWFSLDEDDIAEIKSYFETLQ